MASLVTSAGAGSGMDFESIITASVNAKKTQLTKRVSLQKEETNVEVSGVSKLKSALKTFQDAIAVLTEKDGFNARKVNINQDKDNPYFTITAEKDASNADYDIEVKQKSSTTSVSAMVDKDKEFGARKLTLSVPAPTDKDPDAVKTFEVDIDEGSTLAQIRKAINKNDIGITASIISTDQGDKLIIDSGVSGDKGHFSIEDSGADGFFDINTQGKADGGTDVNPNNSDWTLKAGKDAIIKVDGMELRSSTNEFSNQISGITLNINRVTDTDDGNGGKKSNPVSVSISEDIDGITSKVENFVSAYNTLMDTMDSLYKHNTYSDGKNNYDGGDLAGDNMLRSLQNQIQNMMTNIKANNSGLDIYSVGLDFDAKGKMSLNSSDFKDNIKDNFNAVVNLFSGEDNDPDNVTDKDGILLRLDNILEDYTKGQGILDKRTETLNLEIKRYEEKEARNAEYLEQYEASLRQRYARLDSLITGYNSSLSYLSAALG